MKRNTLKKTATLTLALGALAQPVAHAAVAEQPRLVRPSPTFVAISDATVMEPLSGTTNAVFTVHVSRGGYYRRPVVIGYRTAAVTATDGLDYVGTPAGSTQSIQINPGTTGYIYIPIKADSEDDSGEKFLVELTGAAGENVWITDGQAVGTILDPIDLPPYIPPFDCKDVDACPIIP